MTRQACTSLPGHIFVEQIWFKLCRGLPHVYICIYMYYMYMSYAYTHVYRLICTCTFIYIHTKQFWFVCSMCQTYWAHVFLSGCARQPVTACSPLGSIVRLPALFPTLAALLPALAHSTVLVCTQWHVCVPVLCNCGANCFLNHLYLNQYVDPTSL